MTSRPSRREVLAAHLPSLPGKSGESNRGAYLVEGLMHCGLCHTPKDFAGGWLLSDREVAAVVTYIRNAWGNSAPPVSADDVAKARRDLSKRSD